jgi:hypothetical protein
MSIKRKRGSRLFTRSPFFRGNNQQQSLGEVGGDTNRRIGVNHNFVRVHTNPEHLATASFVTIAFANETTSRVTRPDQGASDSTSGELTTSNLTHNNLGIWNNE